jgi:hypothetical protein
VTDLRNLMPEELSVVIYYFVGISARGHCLFDGESLQYRC